jgi:hypothetical protein
VKKLIRMQSINEHIAARHPRATLGRPLLAALLVAAAALAVLAPAAGAKAADAPRMLIGPSIVHVKNGKIVLKAVCPPTASACTGVILGRLPLARTPGSVLDPGSLGGPFFDLQAGQALRVVFTLTAKTKAFLKTHRKTALYLTVKVLDDQRNESVTKRQLTLYAS